MTPVHPPRRAAGNAISLLLALLAIGLLAWFALRGSAKSPTAAGAPVDCERRIGTLIQQTGGLGEAYRSGYETLPEACKRLVPAPAPDAVSPTQNPG